MQQVGVGFYVCNMVAQKMYNIKCVSGFNMKYICLIINIVFEVMLFLIEISQRDPKRQSPI